VARSVTEKVEWNWQVPPDELNEQILRRGLVGSHRLEYQTNASFRATIDMLAKLLPFWVDGLAEQANKEDIAMKQMVAELMHTPVAPLPITVLERFMTPEERSR
jgi:hypothetical protein